LQQCSGRAHILTDQTQILSSQYHPPTQPEPKQKRERAKKELPLRSNPQSKDKAQDTAEDRTGATLSVPGEGASEGRREWGVGEGKGGEGDSGDLGILTSAP